MLFGTVVGGRVQKGRSRYLSPEGELGLLSLLPKTPGDHCYTVGQVCEAEVSAMPHELGTERPVSVVLAADGGEGHVGVEGDVALQSQTAPGHYPWVQPVQLPAAVGAGVIARMTHTYPEVAEGMLTAPAARWGWGEGGSGVEAS